MRKERLRLELGLLRLAAEGIRIQEVKRNGQTIPVFRDATGKFASSANNIKTPDNQEQVRQTVNYAIAQAGDLRDLPPQQRVLAIKAELENQGLPADDIKEACEDYLKNTKAIESIRASLDKAEQQHPKTTKGIAFALELYGTQEEAKEIAKGLKNGLKETNQVIIAADQGVYDTVGLLINLLDVVEKEKAKEGIEGEIKTAIALLLTILLYIGLPNVAALMRGKDIMLVLANVVGMKTVMKSIKKYVKENPQVLKIPPEKLGYLIGVTMKARGDDMITEKIEDTDLNILAADLLALRKEASDALQT